MEPSELTMSTVNGEERSAELAPRVLVMAVGAGQFTTHPLEPGRTVTIGRDGGCEVQLVNRNVSRRHARIRTGETGPGRVVVEDLGSTNGIYVSGQRIPAGATAELPVGESFRVGPFTVVVTAATPRETGGAHTQIAVADPTPGGVPAVVAKFAESAVSVIIQGETGSGKEVLARTIHQLSGRTGPFLGINVAALSATLLESELFGHERGAFTGASRCRPGLLEAAKRGTVFLDEIGEMPGELQVKLLRAIESREIYRVGGVHPIALDVRFLAATHRDLQAEVAAGRFRRDLMYRLDGVTLQLTPLRRRRGAIPELARGFLAEIAAAAKRPAPRLTAEAVAKLTRYIWPGNVRELRAVIERAFLLCEGDELLPSAVLVDAELPPESSERFVELARRHRGNVTDIARALATSRSQVHRLARRFGIALDRLRAS